MSIFNILYLRRRKKVAPMIVYNRDKRYMGMASTDFTGTSSQHGYDDLQQLTLDCCDTTYMDSTSINQPDRWTQATNVVELANDMDELRIRAWSLLRVKERLPVWHDIENCFEFPITFTDRDRRSFVERRRVRRNGIQIFDTDELKEILHDYIVRQRLIGFGLL